MIEVLKHFPLAKKTFYGIGGPADEIYEVHDTAGLAEIWTETIDQNIPKLILGGGANIALSDKGFRGRVFIPKFDKSKQKNSIFTVEAGRNFQNFIEETNQAGFADLCPLSGIPGNVGGFVRGNAGAYGAQTQDFVTAVTYLDQNGQLQTVSNDRCQFEYRGSLFKYQPDYLILSATFKLTQAEVSPVALNKTKKLQTERWQKYPAGRSGGCVFKNPNAEAGLFAGQILDQLGAKGDQIGQVMISHEHANFFTNRGTATQNDLIKLIKKWQQKVWQAHQVKLEPEIFLGDEYGKKIVI